MCKEDIRLARDASVGVYNNGLSDTSIVKVLGANPNRYSLVFSIYYSAVGGTVCNYFWGTMINGLFYPYAGLTLDHPTKIVTLGDIGQLIFEPVWRFRVNDDVGGDSCVVEMQFTKALKDI